MNDITRRLARFVVESRFEDIPAAVCHEATRALLHWVGCALGGCRHDAVERALAALTEFSGPPQATVLGRSERLDVLHAALVNGISSNVLGFNDTHLKTIIHPTEVVASAILAHAERTLTSGADFLHALILGIEVECRVGNAVYPAHYDVGWHITGTAGVFGAAAATGRLIGLDEQKMSWALGIAATQAAGLREMFGTMSKSLHSGYAARNGIVAALLAARGFTSSERAIEAPRGFAHVASPSRNLAAVTAGLGESYEITLNTYKPFPCGIVIHPAIDGCIELAAEHRPQPEAIAHVMLRVNPLVLELTGRRTPQTTLEAKLSVFHSVAAALVHRTIGEAQYRESVVHDPAVVMVRDRIEAVADSSIHEDEAYISVTFADGRVLGKHVEHAVGSLARPMTDADLENKFRGLAAEVLDGTQAERLIALCWSVSEFDDVAQIAQASVPARDFSN